MKRLFVLFFIFFLSTSVLAYTENQFTFISVVQTERFNKLMSELRCPVCQNQNLAESNAPLAQDLKSEVSRQIHSGRTDDEIKHYLAARYGDYILFKPRVNNATFALWLGPFVFLCGALIILFISIRRQAAEKIQKNETV